MASRTRFANVGVPIFMALLTLGILVSTSSATANMITYPTFDNWRDLILYLLVVNPPIDLFCFSVLILVMCRAYGNEVGKISQKTRVFVATVILASVAIAISGAMIDFFAFYEEDHPPGYSFYWGEGDHAYESSNLYIALVAIFIGVFLAATIIVRTKAIVSAYTAAAITALNFVAWTMILDGSGEFFKTATVVLSTVFWFLAIIPLYRLATWHRRITPMGPVSAMQERV